MVLELFTSRTSFSMAFNSSSSFSSSTSQCDVDRGAFEFMRKMGADTSVHKSVPSIGVRTSAKRQHMRNNWSHICSSTWMSNLMSDLSDLENTLVPKSMPKSELFPINLPI